jgi:hypothetical protein
MQARETQEKHQLQHPRLEFESNRLLLQRWAGGDRLNPDATPITIHNKSTIYKGEDIASNGPKKKKTSYILENG